MVQPRDDLAEERTQLTTLLLDLVPQPGVVEPGIPGLTLYRWEETKSPLSSFHEAALCLVAQGSKRVLLGQTEYRYDADHYLISSVALPIASQVLEASPERPYLGLTWKLDLAALTALVLAHQLVPQAPAAPATMSVERVDLALLRAVHQLVRLAREPRSVAVLAPLVQQELLYRLVTGPQGPYLWQLGSSGSQGAQIARAIAWLKGHFAQRLRVDDLAASVHMSTSSFHHHFKALTTLSPLQYQKWLRLHEARRLMLNEALDAATAAYRVGYESPSQFSREYRRLFEAPPLQDIRHLRSQGLTGFLTAS